MFYETPSRRTRAIMAPDKGKEERDKATLKKDPKADPVAPVPTRRSGNLLSPEPLRDGGPASRGRRARADPFRESRAQTVENGLRALAQRRRGERLRARRATELDRPREAAVRARASGARAWRPSPRPAPAGRRTCPRRVRAAAHGTLVAEQRFPFERACAPPAPRAAAARSRRACCGALAHACRSAGRRPAPAARSSRTARARSAACWPRCRGSPRASDAGR